MLTLRFERPGSNLSPKGSLELVSGRGEMIRGEFPPEWHDASLVMATKTHLARKLRRHLPRIFARAFTSVRDLDFVDEA